MFDNLQGSLADVVADPLDLDPEDEFDWFDHYDIEWDYDDIYDYDDEPDYEPDYSMYDGEEDEPDIEPEPEFEIVLPLIQSLSASRHHFGPLWDGKHRRIDNSKPKRKEHR